MDDTVDVCSCLALLSVLVLSVNTSDFDEVTSVPFTNSKWCFFHSMMSQTCGIQTSIQTDDGSCAAHCLDSETKPDIFLSRSTVMSFKRTSQDLQIIHKDSDQSNDFYVNQRSGQSYGKHKNTSRKLKGSKNQRIRLKKRKKRKMRVKKKR